MRFRMSIKASAVRLHYLDWLRGLGAVIMLHGHVWDSFLRDDLRSVVRFTSASRKGEPENRRPRRRTAGPWSATWRPPPMSTPTVSAATGDTPAGARAHAAATIARFHAMGVAAESWKKPLEFRKASSRAATETRRMYGNIQRVSRTVSSNFPGVVLKPLAKSATIGSARRMPAATRPTRTQTRRTSIRPA